MIVGTSGGAPFRWTAATGIQNFSSSGEAFDTTPDGKTIVGWTRSETGAAEAFRWSEGSGMLNLSAGSANWSATVARGVSDFGSAICGSGLSLSGNQAFRWTQPGGIAGLGDLPGGDFSSTAYGISGDGSTVIGVSSTGFGSEAFIWDETQGMRNLRTTLLDFGLPVGGWSLDMATAISADGSTIVGWGTSPAGRQEGWIAAIPEPTSSHLIVCSLLLLAFFRFQSRSVQSGKSRIWA